MSRATERGPRLCHAQAMDEDPSALLSPRLRPGDRVRLVSPASPPSRDDVDRGVDLLESWGLRVELGRHLLDQWGYCAGRDSERVADLNEAFADPGVRAVIATRGGKGAYRIAQDLDTEALRRDPKPLVGFSDITHLHMACWATCRLTSLHGPFVSTPDNGPDGPAEALRRALMTTEPVILHRNASEATGQVTVDGTASGPLLGGNLDALRTMAGAGLPHLGKSILFLEHKRGTGLGEVDRALTQLIGTGALSEIQGIVLGQFLGFEVDDGDDTLGGWGITDVLQDRLLPLGVPILGGIPAGHGPNPPTIPLGTPTVIDTETGTLTVQPAVT